MAGESVVFHFFRYIRLKYPNSVTKLVTKMLSLYFGCSISNLTVHPKNWRTITASVKKPWYISYRFYDAAFPKPKQILIRGMNIYKTVQERRQMTQEFIDFEMDRLQNKGYNPITESYRLPQEQEGEIFPHTLLIDALRKAKRKSNLK